MDKNIYLSQRKEQIVLVASSGVLYPTEGCRKAAPRTAKLVCRESEKINDLFDAIELKQLGLKVVKYWPLVVVRDKNFQQKISANQSKGVSGSKHWRWKINALSKICNHQHHQQIDLLLWSGFHNAAAAAVVIFLSNLCSKSYCWINKTCLFLSTIWFWEIGR